MSPAAIHRLLRALPLSVALALGACGGEDAPSDSDDSSDEEDAGKTKPDAGKDAARDTSTSKPDTSTAKEDAGPPDPKLEPLAGRYLMRWDVLGTATSPSPVGGDLKIRSRVSTLVVAELKVEGDRLVGTERVCTQDIKQECLDNSCDGASTSVDSRAIKNFLVKRTQPRTYTLSDDGTFTAEPAVAQLGYDDEDPNAAPPTSSDDERVWDVVAGGVREGLLSKIKITLLLTVQCNAYGVQKFASRFSGKLGGTEGAPEFPEMELDLAGSKGETLGADNEACVNGSKNADAPYDISTARMVKFDLSDDDFENCPAVSVFDQELPPTEPDLGN